MEELMLPLVHKKKKKVKPLDEVLEKKRESTSRLKSDKKNKKQTKTTKKVESANVPTKVSAAIATATSVEPKKKEKLTRSDKVLSRKKKKQLIRDEKEEKQEKKPVENESVVEASSNEKIQKINKENPAFVEVAEEKIVLEPEPLSQTLSESVNTEDSVNSEIVEDLPILEVPQEQIDRIHRGRKTTLLTKALKECDWAVGDRIRLPDGTILKILRKEKITMGLNMPEDLVESEGFSSENRAEFARHLQRLGLRANDAAFLYRIELA